MQLNELIKRFREKPYMIDMGKGKLSKWLGASEEDIKKAKKVVRAELNNFSSSKIHASARILLLDIETAPLKAYVWKRWKENIYEDRMISEWFMLTWSAKWLFDDKVIGEAISSEEVLEQDDSRIVKHLWEIMNEADIIIAHNGDRFDIPKINSRFLMNNLPPTSSYQTIDTLKVARKKFGFSSNSLNSLCKQFGFGQKIDTDFELWAKCLEGDDSALNYMLQYNMEDVRLLEDVYLKLRPYIDSHPNVGLYLETEDPVCANCGSKELIEDGSFYYTPTGKYRTYRCICGAINRRRFTEVPKNKRDKLLVSTAR